MNQNEIMELVGADNWGMVVDAFDNSSQAEIEAELNTMYPHEKEDNKVLGEEIWNKLNLPLS